MAIIDLAQQIEDELDMTHAARVFQGRCPQVLPSQAASAGKKPPKREMAGTTDGPSKRVAGENSPGATGSGRVGYAAAPAAVAPACGSAAVMSQPAASPAAVAPAAPAAAYY